jgi:alpha-tubulin suppressor-like RCC1 family protein
MRQIAAGSFSGSISDDNNSSLFLWGTGSFGEFIVPHRVKRIQGEVISVKIGGDFGIALSGQGFLYSWGDNKSG